MQAGGSLWSWRLTAACIKLLAVFQSRKTRVTGIYHSQQQHA